MLRGTGRDHGYAGVRKSSSEERPSTFTFTHARPRPNKWTRAEGILGRPKLLSDAGGAEESGDPPEEQTLHRRPAASQGHRQRHRPRPRGPLPNGRHRSGGGSGRGGHWRGSSQTGRWCCGGGGSGNQAMAYRSPLGGGGGWQPGYLRLIRPHHLQQKTEPGGEAGNWRSIFGIQTFFGL